MLEDWTQCAVCGKVTQLLTKIDIEDGGDGLIKCIACDIDSWLTGNDADKSIDQSRLPISVGTGAV